MKGDKAVFTALKTSARATLPRAINTNNGDDTSVGAKQSLTHSQRTPAKKNRPVSSPASDIGP